MTARNMVSIEAEQSVIGAVLLDNASMDQVAVRLTDAHFSRDDHRTIWRAIQGLLANGRPADLVTVFEALESSGEAERCGGIAYLAEIASSTYSAANIRRYAEIVVERAHLRALAVAADDILGLVADTSMGLADKIQAAQAKVMAVADSGASGNADPQHLRDVLVRHVSLVEARAEGKTSAIPTGFADLDRKLNGGLRGGQLVILAARPGMGKTSLALQIAKNAADRGVVALVCSQEMPEADIADRVISASTGVNLEQMVSGRLDTNNWTLYSSALANLRAIPLYLDDQPALTLLDVFSKARKVLRTAGSLGLVVIDYLQLMSGSGDNRNAELEKISRGLKQLAKEMHVPVLALSQLSRKCEERPNKRPIGSDLRDSGAIEQDADMVMAIYRDEIYNADSPDAGTAEILIRKHRQGPTGDTRLSWRPECAAFADLDFHAWEANKRSVNESFSGFSKKRRSGFYD